MDEVSLTVFMEFVNKAGAAKMAVVSRFKAQPEYGPRFDYWKELRDAIIVMHRQAAAVTTLDNVLAGLTDERKRQNYRNLTTLYRRWMRGKDIRWFNPPRGRWAQGGLTVIANPELGLTIDGTTYLVKLHFKEDSMGRGRADLVTQLMTESVGAGLPPGCQPAVLDIRRSALRVQERPAHVVAAQLQGEAAYWNAVFPTA